MNYFFDMSALFKRDIIESGTNWVRAVALTSAGHTITISDITRVEIMSAVSRRLREGSVNLRNLRAIRIYLGWHIKRDYETIRYADGIANLAQDLCERHPLRAADAIQLASAVAASTRLTAAGLSPLVFVSADTRLLTIAAAEKLPTHLSA